MADAATIIDLLADPGTWAPLPLPAPAPAADEAYAGVLARAQERSGAPESVLVGTVAVQGRPVVVVVGEFGFLAGSVGWDTATRIVAAYDHATAHRLPLVAAPTSGGTRMQEGTPAFLQMVQIAGAAAAHRRSGAVGLVWLRGPTTGGVLATVGSLGQITLAEPGALIGFLGPRVFAEVTGRPFPPGVQTAEHLQQCGVIDAVVARSDLRGLVAQVLAVTGDPAVPTAPPPAAPPPAAPPHPDPQAWAHVLATRDPARPGAADLLARAADPFVRLHGTGAGEPSPGLLLGLARFADRRVVVVACDRRAEAAGERIGPWSLRAARRMLRLAAELGLPVLTIVDTVGAELSQAAEEGAMAGEIARCLADLHDLPVPVVAVLLGQGAGGGALALLPADRVVAAEHAWLTPLPPEGAAAIVHRDAGQAPRMAAEQRITAAALVGLGAVDVVVPEHGDWLDRLAGVVAGMLDEPGPGSRAQRWRSLRRP
jgi:acetyl-CoA carboxylase carboxyl transferase subunit beta